MPVQPTYPGVYIEEIPSGVRTITGVATSITAFIGRALRGPVDTPVTITSFADFERTFGGLWALSTMSYAVRDFYGNGGTQAIIVRVVRRETGDNQEAATTADFADIGAGDSLIQLRAANPGAWGTLLRVRITHVEGDDNLFNLTVRDIGTGFEERYLNISIAPNAPRTLVRVLAPSLLVELTSAAPTARPAAHADVDPGVDPFSDDAPDGSFTEANQGAVDGGTPNDADYRGGTDVTGERRGLVALESVDLFNLLCISQPVRGGDTSPDIYNDALNLCVEKRAMLIVDPPGDFIAPSGATAALTGLRLTGPRARNAALYFPRVLQSDPLADGFIDTFVPCGIVAGVMARTDSQRGVWKAPAGLDSAVNGVVGLSTILTDQQNGLLNPLGVNCLRSFPVHGRVIWGSRTMRGADQQADEYKYIPVRRLALFMEESLFRGTQWVVFEPNDEPLWAQIRLNVGAFMNNLFRQGAFQGTTPREAYFVKCDKESTTQNDIDRGIVNIIVGFAPLKPAEFVIIKLQQMAGQIDV